MTNPMINRSRVPGEFYFESWYQDVDAAFDAIVKSHSSAGGRSTSGPAAMLYRTMREIVDSMRKSPAHVSSTIEGVYRVDWHTSIDTYITISLDRNDASSPEALIVWVQDRAHWLAENG